MQMVYRMYNYHLEPNVLFQLQYVTLLLPSTNVLLQQQQSTTAVLLPPTTFTADGFLNVLFLRKCIAVYIRQHHAF